VALAAVVAGVSAGAATAMPLAPPAAPASDIVAVRNACGLGWHRGPYGVCRPNGAPYVYGPYAYYGPLPPAPRPPRRCWWVDRGYATERVCSW
jgi:hypothetical protein